LLVELVFGTSFHLALSKRKPHQYDGRVALSNVFIWQTAGCEQKQDDGKVGAQR